MSEHVPLPTPSPCDFSRGRDPILLYEGRLEYREANKSVATGDGRVELELLPSPRYVFVMDDARLQAQIVGTGELHVAPVNLDAPVLVTKYALIKGPMKGTIQRGESGTGTSFGEVRFLVANLPSFTGEGLLEERVLAEGVSARSFWAGRLELRSDEWVIKLDERSDHKEVRDRLKGLGGFEITHTASLRRLDGRTFTGEEACDALNAVAGFLGFAVGAWATPLAPAGVDKNGGIVWRDWNARWTSPWRNRMWPFDRDHPADLSDGFAGYMRRWNEPIWNEPLRIATQMYVEANGPITADTSLVLAQTALELIAWVRFVEELQSHEEDDFAGLRAAERLRELLEWMQVDPSIPSQMSALDQAAIQQKWRDGPHAITAMRNALAHPRHRQRLTATGLAARIELQELSLSYVELAVLRLIGFDGDYANRLGVRVAGVVERVPWSRPAPSGP